MVCPAWHTHISPPPRDTSGTRAGEPARPSSRTFPPRFHITLFVNVELPDVHENLPIEAGHMDITHLPDLRGRGAEVKRSPATSGSPARRARWVAGRAREQRAARAAELRKCSAAGAEGEGKPAQRAGVRRDPRACPPYLEHALLFTSSRGLFCHL